jgi:uncharacterized membrane protein YeaQ/YmgE (transglycosylase-associated protein family)
VFEQSKHGHIISGVIGSLLASSVVECVFELSKHGHIINGVIGSMLASSVVKCVFELRSEVKQNVSSCCLSAVALRI